MAPQVPTSKGGATTTVPVKLKRQPSAYQDALFLPDLCIFHIAQYLPLTTIERVYSKLSTRYVTLFRDEAAFHWRLRLLHSTHSLYSPPRCPPGSTWKELYLALYKRRELWVQEDALPGDSTMDAVSEENEERKDLPVWRLPAAAATTENFNIATVTRLKPLSDDDQEEISKSDSKSAVTLPLHQRLALLRLSKGLKSNKEALAHLKREGGWFSSRKWNEEEKENAANSNSSSSSSTAAAAALSSSAGGSDDAPPPLLGGIHEVDAMNSRVVCVDPTKGLREFNFDHVLNNSSQSSTYESAARRLITDLINGYNGTCLVYGQTGSGKTYTMFGPDESFHSNNLKGIIPRACAEILSAIEDRKSGGKANLSNPINGEMSVSYVEIFGNEVSDLLDGGNECGHSKAAAQRYVLSGAAERRVAKLSDVEEILHLGEKEKRRAATAMNERSTRAHSLFIITLKQHCETSGMSATSKLFLADLGGCEQVKKSKVEAGVSKHLQVLKDRTLGDNASNTAESLVENPADKFSVGFQMSDRMREAVNINLGLLALKKCVEALNSKSVSYVPYSDSKLTMLLSAGLGGDSKTSVVVCASRNREHAAETIGALRFGEACGRISKSARNNATMLADLIANIDGEIQTLEIAIEKNEKWTVQIEKRIDSLAEENTLESKAGGMEFKKVTVLTGAEKERKKLEELLKKRAELTGTSLESELGGSKFGGAIGFGKSAADYGLGKNNANGEDDGEVGKYRFADSVDVENIPKALKGKGVSGWSATVDDKSKLAKRAKKANRAKMAYAGIST